jgi:hypothetical protein
MLPLQHPAIEMAGDTGLEPASYSLTVSRLAELDESPVEIGAGNETRTRFTSLEG